MLKSLFRNVTKIAPGMSEGYTGEKAVSEDPWENIYQSMEKGEILQGKVRGVSPDGKDLYVDIGPITGVIPNEEIGEPQPKRLSVFVDGVVAFKIMRVDRPNKVAYLSRKEAITEMSRTTMRELKHDSEKLLEVLEQMDALKSKEEGAEIPEEDRAKLRELAAQARKIGPVRTGTVRAVMKDGAFLDIGGVPVYLPAHEITWGRVEDARELLRPGESFDVRIIRIDFETQWMRASLRALMPDPWENAAERYLKGGIYAGEVRRLTKNGNLIVELEPGVVAICQRLPLNNPSIGSTVRVKIGLVDKDKRYIRGFIAGESRWVV